MSDCNVGLCEELVVPALSFFVSQVINVLCIC